LQPLYVVVTLPLQPPEEQAHGSRVTAAWSLWAATLRWSKALGSPSPVPSAVAWSTPQASEPAPERQRSSAKAASTDRAQLGETRRRFKVAASAGIRKRAPETIDFV